MFDGEMVKRNFPFEKKLDRKFSPNFFLAKSFKMSCLMEKWWEKIPLKKFYASKISGKLDLGNFHQNFSFCKKP